MDTDVDASPGSAGEIRERTGPGAPGAAPSAVAPHRPSERWVEGWERLGRTLSETADLEEFFHSVCRDIAEGFGFSRVLLATVEPGAAQLVARAGYEPGIVAAVYAALRRLYRVSLHPDDAGRVSAAAWCVLRQEQVYVPDASAYSFRPDRTYQVSLLAKALGTREYVLTPLVHGGRSVGMLAVDQRDAGRPIHESERRLLRAIASVVGSVLGPRLPGLSGRLPSAPMEAAPRASAESSPATVPGSGDEGVESDDLADGVFHALPMGALVVRQDGRVLRANRAALDLLGRGRREVLRLPLNRALGSLAPGERRALLQALAGNPGDAVPHRLRLRSDDGGATPVDARVLPLEGPRAGADAAGASGASVPDRRLVLLEDVSEQVEAERLRETFLYMLVHDLKAPLQSVAGFAELLLMGRVGPLNEEQAEFVRRIEAAGGRMLGLVQEILTVRQLGRDGPGIESEPVPVAPLVEELLAGLAGKAIPAGVDLSAELASDIAPLSGDRRRLLELLQNLVDNAIDACEPGGAVRVEGRMERRAEGDFVRLQVVDDGVGLDGSIAKRLLESLSSESRPEPPPDGSRGLGLRIARLIAEAHGGELRLSGEVGHGTTATVLLPAHAAGALPEAP